MNSRCITAAVAMIACLGWSVPATAQSAAEDDAAPKNEGSASEWQLTPRWRVQYDAANIDGPDGLAGTGNVDDVRRARVGVDLKMPSGLKARLEAELATERIELTDAYLEWSANRFKVMLGQQKPQLPLDEENSNLNTSFLERAAFVTAFGFSRRIGISGHYAEDDWGLSGGVYTDPLVLLNDVETNSSSADFRAYWSPQLTKTKLHFGAAYHWRDLNDFGPASTQYRSRPALRITDTRYIGTPALTVAKEHRFGLEAAAVHGRFHFASEAHWLKAQRVGLKDPLFFGAYAEVGVFLSNDSRPLKAGMFGAVTPRKPVGGGGLGAVQLNLRYDHLDLDSGPVIGGKQNGFLASVIWTPAQNFRLMGQYAKLKYTNAAITLNGDRAYSVNVLGVRGQISF